MPFSCDFTFAELAIKFLETDDTDYLHAIVKTDATTHITNHAARFGGWNGSPLELIAQLLKSIGKESLPYIVRNLAFAHEHIMGKADVVALQLLPKDAEFSGKIFFTCGYDIGVAYGENCSLNLAHPKFLADKHELIYYAIHELHHVGFIACKNGVMASLDVSTRKEMARLIEYLTHMEGMGTYAPFALRKQENALNGDSDYVTLQNSAWLNELNREYFEIYRYFKDNPDEVLIDDDWRKLEILSDGKRLWYIVGAHIARTIDEHFGRVHLLNLLFKSSDNFVEQIIDG